MTVRSSFLQAIDGLAASCQLSVVPSPRLTRRYARQVTDGVAYLEVFEDPSYSRPNRLVVSAAIAFESRSIRLVLPSDEESLVIPRVHWTLWVRYLESITRPPWYWRLESSDEEQIAPIVEFLSVQAIPTLMKHASDQVLSDELRKPDSPYPSSTDRLCWLAILVARIGPADDLPALEARVRALAESGSTDAEAVLAFLKASGR